MAYLNRKDFYWMIPSALVLGGLLSTIQTGNWFIGWLSFSFLFLLAFIFLTISTRWSNGGKSLAWMVTLAFILRFAGGVGTYLILPINGYDDVDDQSGYVYTDARRRDTQAWELATSERPILNAFQQKYAYDQYGGLLAFSALTYRYLSPDAHRALILVLISALMGAIGVPFLWKAVSLQWDERTASVSTWIFALYPESILLGGSAMREPYLLAFSAFALWGFTGWQTNHDKKSLMWLGFGIAGMLLVSPVVALITIVILGGWIYFTSERHRISWWMIAIVILVFIFGLLILSSSLERGNLAGGSPFAVINNFIRESLKWNVYKMEEDSGWVQKLFSQMPEWLHLPFVAVYGVLQPVLPAILIAPTTPIWKVIGILRSIGWYALLPMLIMSWVAVTSIPEEAKRKFVMWLSLIVWGWIFSQHCVAAEINGIILVIAQFYFYGRRFWLGMFGCGGVR
ncbi:MAG: hypothetical protein HC797_00760 [Anaerolineales bacterium]|nr:hypothetical protein [Anaerolineales bacterium]